METSPRNSRTGSTGWFQPWRDTMKAPITFAIGVAVLLLCAVQFALDHSLVRLVGVAVGGFFVVFGGWVGWTRYRGFTLVLGHIAVTLGCLVTAYAVYQIPGIRVAPSLVEVLDLPLFWGLFTLLGGVCIINHGTCACCIRQHEHRVANTGRPGRAPPQ